GPGTSPAPGPAAAVRRAHDRRRGRLGGAAAGAAILHLPAVLDLLRQPPVRWAPLPQPPLPQPPLLLSPARGYQCTQRILCANDTPSDDGSSDGWAGRSRSGPPRAACESGKSL